MSSATIIATTTPASTKHSGSKLLDQYNDVDYPTSRSLPFPYPSGPYAQQAALMDALLQGIPRNNTNGSEVGNEQNARILALESPTGTGKSLSLACAGLAWLDHEERIYFGNPSDTSEKSRTKMPSPTSVIPASTTTNTTGIDWLDSWQPPSCAEEDDEKEKERNAQRREEERHQQLLQKLEDLRIQLHPSSGGESTKERERQRQRQRERRENMLRMALTKSRMDERRRMREKNRKRKRNAGTLTKTTAPSLAYEEEDDDDNDQDSDKNYFSYEAHLQRKLEKLTPGTAEWLLQPRLRQEGSKTNQSKKPPQIVYAARTHSQLSQFVQEIRKTKWGQSLRVVALGSRGQGLCGELTKNHSTKNNSCCTSPEARLTETCLDRKKSKSCSHYSSDESVATLALHGLVEATDLEDLASLGKATKTCAYYATRKALPHAQLVLVPYTSLCSAKSRSALGLELHSNSLVLVDEAHNLPNAIGNLTSALLTLSQATSAKGQLETYLSKYMDRLSAPHLRWLGQLKQLTRGLIASMTLREKGSKCQQQQESRRSLMSSSQFLVSQKLETINLFPILRYMEESKLSQKLLGFLKRPNATEDKGGAQNVDVSSHISPMSIVETFLEKLTYESDTDGKVIIDQGSDTIRNQESNIATYEKEPQLRFCVLNPAVHACDELWTAPRAVALVGGTLQPLDVMMRELVPGTVAEHAGRAQASWNQSTANITNKSTIAISNPYQNQDHRSSRSSESHKLYKSDDFWAFTCGHVVDSSHVLLQSMTTVNGVPIDVRHKTRSTPSVTSAIGTALVRLRKSVPNGMVVFLPSYKYESIIVEAWKKNSIWNQLQQATTVIREPKEASQVESTLSRYAKAATKSSNGALLLSVIGGKLSEGINFADDLCRCVVVVGLPFADMSDPLLQEKLKLIGESRNGLGAIGIQSQAARDYYRSLCLRAVNQSVGRAIRHAKDWASIVLMDMRYPTDENIARGLPSWLTDSTPSWRRDSGDLDDVIRRTDSFFRSSLR